MQGGVAHGLFSPLKVFPIFVLSLEWEWARKAVGRTQDALRYDFRAPSLTA